MRDGLGLSWIILDYFGLMDVWIEWGMVRIGGSMNSFMSHFILFYLYIFCIIYSVLCIIYYILILLYYYHLITLNTVSYIISYIIYTILSIDSPILM